MSSRERSSPDAKAMQGVRDRWCASIKLDLARQDLLKDLAWCLQHCLVSGAQQCGLLEGETSSSPSAEVLRTLLKALRRAWTQLAVADQNLLKVQLVAAACDRLLPADVARAVLRTVTTLCHKCTDFTEHRSSHTAHVLLGVLRSRVTACPEMQLLDDGNR